MKTIDFGNMPLDDINLLIENILDYENGVFVFDGPTASGKTSLLNLILERKSYVRKFSDEQFVEIILKEFKEGRSAECIIDNVTRFLNEYKIIAVEEIDMLWGRPYTLEVIAEIINKVSKNHLVIFTGISIEERVPELIKNLGGAKFVYFKRKEE